MAEYLVVVVIEDHHVPVTPGVRGLITGAALFLVDAEVPHGRRASEPRGSRVGAASWLLLTPEEAARLTDASIRSTRTLGVVEGRC